jgi:hypothetical protein
MSDHLNVNDNVVRRLKDKLKEARSYGLKIRMEMLCDEQASWCVVGGTPTLFVDLSQSVAEQLRQVDETLQAYLAHQRAA